MKELFPRALALSQHPKSIFLSYGWDDPPHRDWTFALAKFLKSKGYQVVLDRDEKLKPEEVAWLGMFCRNVLSVVTPKFMEVCLMGRIEATIHHTSLPSFSRAHDDDLIDKRLASLVLLNAALSAYSQIQSGNAPSTADLRARAEKAGLYSFYLEGWCLDEHQILLENEDRFVRIATIYRSGENCFCRYPIIDCSARIKEDDARQSILEYLEFPPIQGHKGLGGPAIWSTTRGVDGSVINTLWPASRTAHNLQHVTFWKS